jgi:flagellar assembly factor FliW
LLDDPTDEVFAWLQSCEEGSIAFPVLEPELFLDKPYKVELSKNELTSLEVNTAEECRFFTIITIPDDPTKMTANLKAPIVINVKKRIARQCILQSSRYEIRTPIFSILQQRVVQNPNFSFKETSEEMDVSISLESLKTKEINL